MPSAISASDGASRPGSRPSRRALRRLATAITTGSVPMIMVGTGPPALDGAGQAQVVQQVADGGQLQRLDPVGAAQLAQRAGPARPAAARSGRRPGSAPPIARPPDTRAAAAGPRTPAPHQAGGQGVQGSSPHRSLRFQTRKTRPVYRRQERAVLYQIAARALAAHSRDRVGSAGAAPACSAIRGLRRASASGSARRDAVAPGEGPGQVGLVGQASRQRDLGGRLAGGQAALGLEQAQRHQHLLRRGVAMRLEAAQKWKGLRPASRASSSSVSRRDRCARIVDHRREARAPARAGRGTRAWRRNSASSACALSSQRSRAQGVEQGGDARARVQAHGRVEPPAVLARHARDHVGVDVSHAVAPATLGLGAAGVQFIDSSAPPSRTAPGDRRHGSGRRSAGFDGAQPEGVVVWARRRGG